jgi:hypothetical protein
MSMHSPRKVPTGSRDSQLGRYVYSPAMFSSTRKQTRPRISNPGSASIHSLDGDSLLHIFYLSRPSVFKVDLYGGFLWDWNDERWWYKAAQVCRRWRHLVLGSASHLGLCLVCTPGTPVTDMLAHSPPFPLIIQHRNPNRQLTAEDEKGIMHALQHRDRVRRIHLRLPVQSLQKLITALDGEFPSLEFLHISAQTKHDSSLALPPQLEAPHLRNLCLTHFASPIGSPLLSTTTGLVILSLEWIHPSTYPHPNDFLRQLLLLPQLEEIDIGFRSAIPSRDIEEQLLHTPVVQRVTLPNLRVFSFNLRVFSFMGISAFLEALLPRLTTPLLETFRVRFFNQPSLSVQFLLHFMTTAEKLRFSEAGFLFYHEGVAMFLYPHVGPQVENVSIMLPCSHLDWQVSFAAHISNVLSPLLSKVVDLTLDYREHGLSSEPHNQADYTQWVELLESFRNVGTLRVHKGLVGELSRALQPDRELPLEVLPELKVLVCPTGIVDDKTFASFIHEREVTGRPVSLVELTFPVGNYPYEFPASTGISHVEPDPGPLTTMPSIRHGGWPGVVL